MENFSNDKEIGWRKLEPPMKIEYKQTKTVIAGVKPNENGVYNIKPQKPVNNLYAQEEVKPVAVQPRKYQSFELDKKAELKYTI